MKRWTGILILALLLCGCGNQDPAPTTVPQDAATVSPSESVTAPTDTDETDATLPSEPQVTVDNSAPLNSMAADGRYAAAMGSNLLLFSENGLSLYSFGSASPAAAVPFAGRTPPALPFPGGE